MQKYDEKKRKKNSKQRKKRGKRGEGEIRCKQFSASVKVPRRFYEIRLFGYFIRVGSPFFSFFCFCLSLSLFHKTFSTDFFFSLTFFFCPSVIVRYGERILIVCSCLNWPPVSASQLSVKLFLSIPLPVPFGSNDWPNVITNE